MPTEFHKKAIKLNERQVFSFKPVALVEMFYSSLRAGKPLLGLAFYDAFDRKILQVGKSSSKKTVLKVEPDEKILGFRSSG